MSPEARPLPAGTRIELRDEEWLVRRCQAITGGGYELHVTGVSELVQGHQAVFLTALETPKELRPEATVFVNDTSTGYRQARLYLDAQLRRTPAVDPDLHLGPLGAINPAEYQLEPARRALAQPRPRLLIADAVGLGKTIEVGILVAELIQRGRGDRILCLAKKSMLAQFQQELWTRFNIPLVRLDSLGIARLRSRIPTNKNPFACYNRIIISVDTLKETRASTSYRHFLEQFKWDIVIIDEAHNCANAGTANNDLAQRVCRNAEAVVLTTATPHNGKPESFAELIRLLDPTAIRDVTNYGADDIGNYFIRRFKKDVADEVGEHFRERQLHTHRSLASPSEEQIFNRLGDLRLQALSQSRSKEDQLLRYVLYKTYLSSPEAAASTLATRIGEAKKRIDAGKGSHLTDHLVDLEDLHGKIAKQSLTNSARFAAFLGVLKSLGFPKHDDPNSRIICFTESLTTQKALADAIRKQFKLGEDVVVTMHGGMTDVEQALIIDTFGKGDAPVRLLIATDVASEGVNLHYHCHELIHYDLPWSLIRLEQRNGRIDRYGQVHEPAVHYLLVDTACAAFTGDQRIVDALLHKVDAVYQNTGDAAGVMAIFDADEEERITGERAADAAKTGTVDIDAVLSPKDDNARFMEELLAAATRLGEDATPYVAVPAGQTAPAWPRLFADETAWLKAAWAEVFGSDPQAPQPDWHPQRPECELKATDELIHRCGGRTGSRTALIPGATAIPDEAFPANWSFRLTTDREAVNDGIKRARVLAQAGAAAPKSRGRKAKAPTARPVEEIALAPELRSSWPDLSLLWDLHPVSQWLVDRLLIHFGRGQAPLVISSHIPANEVWFCFRGALTNQNGREVIVDWFTVRCDSEAGAELGEFAADDVLPLRQALKDAKFDALSRSGKERDVTAILPPLCQRACRTATEYMQRLRGERAKLLGSDLKTQQQRLKTWAAAQKVQADAAAARLDPTSRAYRAHLGRIQRISTRADALVESEKNWLDRSMKTVNEPVLRIALAIAGTGVKA